MHIPENSPRSFNRSATQPSFSLDQQSASSNEPTQSATSGKAESHGAGSDRKAGQEAPSSKKKEGGKPPDAELLRQARNGDDWAFRQLVHRYEPKVAATVVGMLGPGPEADDVGQRVFVRFYESLDDFEERSALGTYLTRIAINLSLNEARRQRRWYNRFLPWDFDENTLSSRRSHELTEWDTQDAIHEALDNLAPKHRSVVVLRLVEGYSTRETADLLDVPEGTVLSRLARAKTQLKDMLAPHFSDLNPTDYDDE